jgi:two-component system phosphate regulon response regulator PhoB
MADELILIVEDDTDIQELLEYNLSRTGYRVECAETGEDGLIAARQHEPDLVVLDLMLPGLSGIEVCRRLKTDPSTAELPIIILTAKGEEEDIVVGFEAGADDYVTKPFSPRVFMARVEAVLRRRRGSSAEDDGVLRVFDITVHPGRHEARVAEQIIPLTHSEFGILQFLASRPGWVFTRNQIVRAVHGDDYPVTGRSVDVQIVALRKKLGAAGKHIETVRGVGYKLGD